MKKLPDQTGKALASAARCAIAVFTALFALPGGARGATDDDVRLFRLTGISGFAELGFLTALEDRNRSNSPDSDFDRVEFSQLLRVNTSAYFYHPSFLTFQGGFQVEFVEDVIETDRNRILAGGDWRFNFLQNHRESLSIFGRVLETESSRPFTGTYSVMSQLYGVRFNERRGWVPFSLTYQHRSISSDGSSGFDDSADEILFNGSYQLGKRSNGSINYDLVFQDLGGNDVRRQDLSINNLSQFGDEGEKRFYANFFFNEQVIELESASTERRTVNGVTNFNWRHTDDLWTEYNLSARWSKAGSQDVTNVNPTFSITHKLYESLTTQAEIFGRLQEASTGSLNQFGGVLSETYVKRLGAWGRLSLRASSQIVMSYDRPEGDTAFVFDESHQMTIAPDPLPRLLNRNVIESTIVVTNANCPSELCEEGLDYELVPIGGGFIELSLPAAERFLGEGDTVLVSYTFELGEKGDTLNTGVNVGANLAIREHLELFGSHETTDQKLISGDRQEFEFNEYDRSVVGLQLRWPWFVATSEFENYDATFASFRGYSGSISVFTNTKGSWRGRLGTGCSFRDYTDGGDNMYRLRVSGGVRRRLFRRGELELDGRYRREHWSGSLSVNNTDTVFVNAGYSWWYGKFNVKLEGGIGQIMREAEDKSVYRVNLRARRSF